MTLSLIFLAGGLGQRFGSPTPKQFTELFGRPLALYSLEILLSLPSIEEVIIVCEDAYRSLFPASSLFAKPGKRRQDSLFNALQLATKEFLLIHDAARPFISKKMVQNLIDEGRQIGAATLAMPLKFTVKEKNETDRVTTLERSRLFEIQTPQLLKRSIAIEGFGKLEDKEATDDVFLAELLNLPVKLVPGAYTNIKITTPEDLLLAKAYAQL